MTERQSRAQAGNQDDGRRTGNHGSERLRRTRNVKDGGIKAYCVGGGGKGRREDLGEGRRSKCDEEKVEGRHEGCGSEEGKVRGGRMEGRLSRAEKKGVARVRPPSPRFSSSPRRPITLCNMI